MPTTPESELPRLWTPKELEAHYRRRITAHAIRALVTARRVPYTRGATSQVLFTDAQIPALLAAMAEEPQAVQTSDAA